MKTVKDETLTERKNVVLVQTSRQFFEKDFNKETRTGKIYYEYNLFSCEWIEDEFGRKHLKLIAMIPDTRLTRMEIKNFVYFSATEVRKCAQTGTFLELKNEIQIMPVAIINGEIHLRDKFGEFKEYYAA